MEIPDFDADWFLDDPWVMRLVGPAVVLINERSGEHYAKVSERNNAVGIDHTSGRLRSRYRK